MIVFSQTPDMKPICAIHIVCMAMLVQSTAVSSSLAGRSKIDEHVFGEGAGWRGEDYVRARDVLVARGKSLVPFLERKAVSTNSNERLFAGILTSRIKDPEAVETWEDWHKRHGPEFVGGMDKLPDEINEPIGRAVSITYRSDKWDNPGEYTDYIHDFTEGLPPLVYVDNATRPRAFVLSGGDFTVTEDGID